MNAYGAGIHGVVRLDEGLNTIEHQQRACGMNEPSKMTTETDYNMS
jgi:hypothetical protein